MPDKLNSRFTDNPGIRLLEGVSIDDLVQQAKENGGKLPVPPIEVEEPKPKKDVKSIRNKYR